MTVKNATQYHTCSDAPYVVCSGWNSTYDGICSHKDLFPLTGMEIFGTIVLILIMALATMAGIGGGGVVVFLI